MNKQYPKQDPSETSNEGVVPNVKKPDPLAPPSAPGPKFDRDPLPKGSVRPIPPTP